MTESKKTVDCPIHKTEMPVSVCIARQKILAESPADGNKGEAYKIYRKSCGKCKIGLDLYRLEKLKAEASTSEKPVPVTPDESKTCPCGEKFNRQPDQNDVSWTRSKYCPDCAALTQYYRKKKFAKTSVSESEIGKNSVEVVRDVEFKNCKHCGEKFFKTTGQTKHSWGNVEYCNTCRREVENINNRAKKKRYREMIAAAKIFDQEKAEKIAMAMAEESLKLISMFVTSSTHLEQMRALAVRVGIDSQKAAHDAVWG